MDEVTALHTAARRVCLAFLASWEALPRDEVPWSRYRLVDAILHRVEGLVPEAFPDTAALRVALLRAGREAAVYATVPPDAEELREMAEERVRFLAAVAALTRDDPRRVRPLPYRHVLSERETARVWARLRRRWGMQRGAYWFPLTGEAPPHLLALQAAWFWRYVPMEALRRALAAHRVRRVWQLQRPIFPDDVDYELAPELLRPLSRGNEAVWVSDKMDWVLRASHESSVTVGGAWLLGVVKQTWPGWRDHLYVDYRYPAPPKEP